MEVDLTLQVVTELAVLMVEVCPALDVVQASIADFDIHCVVKAVLEVRIFGLVEVELVYSGMW